MKKTVVMEVYPHLAHLHFSFAAEKTLRYDDTEMQLYFSGTRENRNFSIFAVIQKFEIKM